MRRPQVAITDLHGCADAAGVVVVIDVLRACTTAAWAFAAGASRIIPVRTVDEARALRTTDPSLRLMGEVEGLPVPGFDYPNAPSAIRHATLCGLTLVHRTTAGTRGLVGCGGADVLLAAAFVNAGATIRYVRGLDPARVTLVATGAGPDTGAEDRACAEYLAARLRGQRPDPAPYLKRVTGAAHAEVFADPDRPEFPADDLVLATAVDTVPLALVARRLGGRLVLEAVSP